MNYAISILEKEFVNMALKFEWTTVIEVSGRRYVYENVDTYKGGKRK